VTRVKHFTAWIAEVVLASAVLAVLLGLSFWETVVMGRGIDEQMEDEAS
jgi:hypothetical protein